LIISSGIANIFSSKIEVSLLFRTKISGATHLIIAEVKALEYSS